MDPMFNFQKNIIAYFIINKIGRIQGMERTICTISVRKLQPHNTDL